VVSEGIIFPGSAMPRKFVLNLLTTNIDERVMANFYNQGINDIRDQLKTSETEGLSSAEANRRLEEYGQNILEEKGRKSIITMFFFQFKSLMIIILLVAAAISGVVGVMEGEGLLDTFVILGILVVKSIA
jgi:P-type Ca2+ transporter type 2C